MNVFKLKFIENPPYDGKAEVILGEYPENEDGDTCLTERCGDYEFFKEQVDDLKNQLDSILRVAKTKFDSN
jgi:hypothetical protein